MSYLKDFFRTILFIPLPSRLVCNEEEYLLLYYYIYQKNMKFLLHTFVLKIYLIWVTRRYNVFVTTAAY